MARNTPREYREVWVVLTRAKFDTKGNTGQSCAGAQRQRAGYTLQTMHYQCSGLHAN
jgi:hypothetical protein